MIRNFFVLFILLTITSFFVYSQTPEFRNTSKSIDERMNALMRELTTPEKINLLCADADSIPRLGIPAYNWWNECLHGIARAGKATVFPKPINLSCTWDTALVKQIAAAISDEGRAKYHKTLDDKGYTERYEGITFFSPTLNISRDPRWGRNDETFGEDPYLNSLMGLVFVQGIQGNHPEYLKAVATPKHFVANNEEDRRHSGSATVDMKSLREYYFPAFKTAINKGKATSVMGAYNALNGVPCCANPFLLTQVLRNEWGFNGVVMSDGSAVKKIYTHHHYADSEVEGAAKALLAGCDMSLRDEYNSTLQQALDQQLINIEDINQAVKRVLKLRFRLGMFDPPERVPFSQLPYNIVECEKHRLLALEAARKSILLLKNETVLPLPADKKLTIAVIGAAAKEVYFGDYSGRSSSAVSLLDGIKTKKQNREFELLYASDEEVVSAIDSKYFQREKKYEYEGRYGLMAQFFDNAELKGEPVYQKPVSQINHQWGWQSPDKIKNPDNFSIRYIAFLVPPVSGTYNFYLAADDGARLYLDDKLVVDAWEKQVKVKKVIDLVKGKKYKFVFEYCERGKKAFTDLSWEIPVKEKQNSIEKIANKADYAIVFIRDAGGSEGQDRKTLNMQPEQLDLFKKVRKINPNTIAVISSSTPLAINWIKDSVPAILYSWIPGQAEGQALADILFGDYNPSAKASVTFFADENELPPIDSYDITKGRTYKYFKGNILFPFGYGLSYTQFDYKKLTVNTENLIPRGVIAVECEIKNTGNRYGEEIVQCYIKNHKNNEEALPLTLAGFKRIKLNTGKSKKVRFTLSTDQLKIWKNGKWQIEKGEYDIFIGRSSTDIALKDRIILRK